MKTEKADLNELIADLSEPLLIMADVAGVDYICQIPDGIVLWADVHWLKEALSNIIKNCIEHTDAGGFVKISAAQNNLHTMHLQKVKKEKKVLYDGISIKRNEIAAKHNNTL